MASSDHIPEEVIEEILYNLPVKSLLQCTTVCRSWNSLIKTPNFISTHFRKSPFSNTNNPQLVVLRLSPLDNGWPGTQYQYSLCCDNKQLDDKNEHIRPVLLANVPFFKSAGSCDGLICLFNGMCYKIILWNPSIRKTLTISKFNTSIRNPMCAARGFNDLLGIGFDSNTNDFKVLRMMTEFYTGDLIKADLYSLKSDSLKDITHITPKHRYLADICYSSRLCVPFFVNGAFHWVGCDREKKILKLMVFDVRDEVFGEIMLPECLKNYNFFYHDHIVSVIAYGESSIAVTRSGTTDLWVMKEYGVVESWVKMFEIVGTCLEGTGKSIVLGITNNAEIILEYYKGRKIVSYDLKTQQIKNHLIPRMHRGYSFVYNYMESLSLIDQEKNYSDEIIIPMH